MKATLGFGPTDFRRELRGLATSINGSSGLDVTDDDDESFLSLALVGVDCKENKVLRSSSVLIHMYFTCA